MSLKCVEKGLKSDQGRSVCRCVGDLQRRGCAEVRDSVTCVPGLGEKYETGGKVCVGSEVDAPVSCVRFVSLLVISFNR